MNLGLTSQNTVNAGTDVLTAGANENLTGSAFADTLTGTATVNTIDGLAGNDSIDGGAGNDALTGGTGTDSVSGSAGDDTILVRDQAADSVNCGSEIDTVTADQVDTGMVGCETVNVPQPAQITAGPSDGARIGTQQATYSFTASAPAWFECKLDAAVFASCTSPYSTASQADGLHTFSVRALDGVGDVNTTAVSRTFTVDTLPPDTTITSGPGNGSFTNATTPTFGLSSEAGATFECKLDTGSYDACSAPFQTAELIDGQHTVYVRAIDTVGNVDQSPATRTFTVDTQMPVITITAPASGASIASTSVSVLYSATDANSITVTCQLDGGTPAVCASPFVNSSLSEAQHTVTISATDAAGNVASAPVTFTVDLTAPDTAFAAGPADGSFVTTATPSFSFSSEAGATYECSIDSGTYATCTSPFTTPTLSNAAHTLNVRASDAAGNVDASPASRQFTVDTVPLVTTFTRGPAGQTDDNEPVFAYTANKAGATFECAMDGADLTPCAAEYSSVPLSVGYHNFYVRALKNGIVEAIKGYAFRVYPRAVVDSRPPSPSPGTTATFSFHGSVPGATFTCSVDSAAWAACTSPLSVDLQLANPGAAVDGAHSLSINSSASGWNSLAATTVNFYTFSQTRNDLKITSGPASGERLTAFDASYAFQASPSLVSFECASDGSPFAPCTSPFVLSSSNAGVHAFAVRGLDVFGQPGPTVSRWVTFEGQPPTADTSAPETSIDSGLANGGTSPSGVVTFGFSASEPATFTCSVDGEAEHACSSPFSTVNLADGAHTFLVRAQDGSSNADSTPVTRAFTVTTDLSKRPNTIIDTPPNDQTFEATFHSNIAGADFECSVDGETWEPCDSPYVVRPNGRELTYNLWEGLNHSFAVRSRANEMTDDTPASVNFRYLARQYAVWFAAGPAEGERIDVNHASFTLGVSLNISHHECALDDGPFVTCGTSFDANALADGQHTVAVSATGYDRPTSQIIRRSFVVDASQAVRSNDPASDTTIVFGPGIETVTTHEVAFGFQSAPTDTHECAIDDGWFTACSSPFNTPSLENGDHAFRVKSVHADGSKGGPAVRHFTVDVVPSPTSIDDLMEPGPTGERLTASAMQHLTDAMYAELANSGASSSSVQTMAANPMAPASNPTPESTQQSSLVDLYTGAGVLPSPASVVAETGSLPGSRTQLTVTISKSNGQALPTVYYNMYGGDWEAQTSMNVLGGYPVYTVATGMALMHIQGQDLMVVGGFDNRVYCDACNGNTSTFTQGPERKCNANWDDNYHFDPWWGHGSFSVATYDISEEDVMCDDGLLGHFKVSYGALTPSAAWSALGGNISGHGDGCAPSLCYHRHITLTDADAADLAGKCRTEEFRDLCKQNGGLDGLNPDYYGPNADGSGAGDPVNTATGNFVQQTTDLALPGRGPALKMERTFNSLNSRVSEVGRGWSWAGTERIGYTPEGDVQLLRADGRRDTFRHQADGSFTAPYGVTDQLITFAAGDTRFEVTTLDGSSKKRYNVLGRLATVSDHFGNQNVYTYNSADQLTDITAPNGQSLSFAYTAAGMLSTATDSTGRTITYPGTEDLGSVTNPDGKYVRYVTGNNAQGQKTLTVEAQDHRMVTTTTLDADG
ncbi:MAG: hypothetical protein JHC87_03395, partial [Thermoleophilaceae bacterium]|nr:hypothetical protein [Thermoleophilaceae bacterium]